MSVDDGSIGGGGLGMAVGVLVTERPRPPLPPEAQPLGRAALWLEARGQAVVFGARTGGGRISGLRAVPGGWVPAEAVAVVGVYDRFLGRYDPQGYAQALAGLEGVPVANDQTITAICRDKRRTQAILTGGGVPMPPIETDPLRFAEAVAQWGRGFLKPAYGACGRGVRAVAPGEALPAEVEGYVPGVAEPAFVQQAVAPPRGFAGVSVRALVQREEAGWVVVPMVARCSVTDPVVAVGRGAEAVPLSEAFPEAVAPSTALVLRCAGVLAGCTAPSGFVEVGFDLVLDEDHQPHLIEANSRPWGRLERLADGDGRWAKEHLEAALRPLRAVGRGLLSP